MPYTKNNIFMALCLLCVLFACRVQHVSRDADLTLPCDRGTDVFELSPDNLMDDVLSRSSVLVKAVIAKPEKYETQIIYTRINRDGHGRPQFRHYGYRVNPKAYFNPASLVKLPVACLALQKINELHIPGLNRDTRLEIGKQHHCQTAAATDTTAPAGYPTIGQYVQKALLVSDNDAYNRLYEFLGQEYSNTSLWCRGYPNVRIIRRFNGCDADENRYTNPVTFYGEDNSVVYAQPMMVNTNLLSNPLGAVLKGKAHIDSRGRYVPRPFDYTYHNYIGLQDIHTMLQSLFFPECFPDKMRFHLTEQDYVLLYHCLSSLPRESAIAAYHNGKKYPDNYKKYFIFGDAQDGVISDRSIQIFNVVGQSDGYLADCAYIHNPAANIEFFLSAVIYVNNDEVMKDGKYEYKKVGIPFLSELGRTIYAYEQSRIH